MAAEDSKDILKNVDWKTVGGAVTTESSKPVVKKRLPKKVKSLIAIFSLGDLGLLHWQSMVLFVLLVLVQGCFLRFG